MADLTQTAANVHGHVGYSKLDVVYGGAVQAGEPVYLATDTKYYKADNSTSVNAAAVGIAITGGGADEPGIIQKTGGIDLGATLVVGEVYCVSNTAGKIAPVADIGVGEYQTVLGIATDVDKMVMGIQVSGVAHA